jgi:hypothetical protein
VQPFWPKHTANARHAGSASHAAIWLAHTEHEHPGTKLHSEPAGGDSHERPAPVQRGGSAPTAASPGAPPAPPAPPDPPSGAKGTQPTPGGPSMPHGPYGPTQQPGAPPDAVGQACASHWGKGVQTGGPLPGNGKYPHGPLGPTQQGGPAAVGHCETSHAATGAQPRGPSAPHGPVGPRQHPGPVLVGGHC